MDDDDLLARVLDALAPLGVETRRLFGSRRLYHEGRFFGFITGGPLYFHTNDANRPDYIARDMNAFQPPGRPRGPRTVDRNFDVPGDVLEDRVLFLAWATNAVAAGSR